MRGTLYMSLTVLEKQTRRKCECGAEHTKADGWDGVLVAPVPRQARAVRLEGVLRKEFAKERGTDSERARQAHFGYPAQLRRNWVIDFAWMSTNCILPTRPLPSP